MTSLETKVAVVTGSSSGIGRATALELGKGGFSLVLHARRNLSSLQSVAEQLRRSSGSDTRVLCITGDIACPQACGDLVAAAFAWQGRVDAWINNAGADVLTGNAPQQTFEQRLQQLIAVDVLGTVRLSRLVAARLQRQLDKSTANATAPTIINMSWDQAALGMEGEPGQLFGTAKAAVAAFSTSLAMSLPGIRVNCVAPGWIQTEWGKTAATASWQQRAIDESLASRWGTAEDIARLIGWLASDSSQFVNGQILSANGGRRFYPPR